MSQDLAPDFGSLVGARCTALEDDVHPDESASNAAVEVEGGTPAAQQKKGKGKGRKGKGKAQTKAAPKGGHMQCELCEEFFPVTDFPINHNKCYMCKQDWDSLGRMCRRQGHADWWCQLHSGDLKAKRKAWKSFRVKFRAVSCPLAKKQFSLLNMLETFRVTSALDTIDSGKMMWKDEAVSYWKSTPGGSYSHDEASKMWGAGVADPSSLVGKDGPEKAPTTLWVQTGKLVNKRGTLETSREMQLSNSKKKFSDQDVQMWKKHCGGSHDTVASVSAADLDGLVRGAAGSSSSTIACLGDSMFAHGNSINIDLKHIGLIGEDGEQEKCAEVPAAEQAGGDEEEAEAAPTSSTWFDARTAQSRNVRQWRRAVAILEKELQGVQSELKQKAEMEIPAADRQHFELAKQVVQERLTPIEAVLDPLPQKLQSYLSEVFESRVPVPCANCTKLCTLTELKGLASLFLSAESEQLMGKAVEAATSKKQALLSLTRAARAAVAEFQSAEKAVEVQKGLEKSHKVATTKKRGRPVKGPGLSGVQELAPIVLKIVPIHDEKGSDTHIDLRIPHLVPGSEVGKAFRRSTHAINQESTQFVAAFDKSELKRTLGRAARQLYDEGLQDRCVDLLTRHMQKALAPFAELRKIDAVKGAVLASHTGMIKNSISASCEAEYLATVRTTLEGCRFVVMLPYFHLATYLTTPQCGEPPAFASKDAITDECAKTWFNNANKEELEALARLAGHMCYSATVGAGDTLYTPSGWYVWEKALNHSDIVGLRVSIVVRSDHELHQLKMYSVQSAVCKAAAEHLEKALKEDRAAPTPTAAEGAAPVTAGGAEATSAVEAPTA